MNNSYSIAEYLYLKAIRELAYLDKLIFGADRKNCGPYRADSSKRYGALQLSEASLRSDAQLHRGLP